ncbi:MAG: hypothetical protein QUU85_14910 [Candidatus Eisenbacteria bacterium]|nr:hypothetical protein [Candidatus Eisenbacteria bacterium]
MNISRLFAAATIPLAVVCIFTGPAFAVAVGQVDDFEDGTTMGWHVGLPHPVPPQNMPDGGPLGDGDNFMLIAAIGGNGPGSKLAVINDAQWAGDYTGAGVITIEMDVNNYSETDLYLRLLFEDPIGGPPADAAITDAIVIPAGSGWTHASFPVTASDLTVLLGEFDTLLSNTTAIRIFHSPEPVYPPPPVIARVGIDNIGALGAPTATAASTWGTVRALFR